MRHLVFASLALSLFGCSEAPIATEPVSTVTATTGSGGEGAGGETSAGGSGGEGGSGGIPDPGPMVDTSDPQLYATEFTPDEADPAADEVLGTQLAYLDTRVAPKGILVVYLHGAGTPTTCGSTEHGTVLAGLGYHVLSPCYHSGYGVGNCDDDIEGCRLEAFEGLDHHPFVDIAPPNSAETRIAKGLAFVQSQNPEGDWTYFLEGEGPRWTKIIISGISHGASSSGVIALHRLVYGAVMLSGPLDSGQAWLAKPPLTPIERFFGFTHTDDGQHPGHLEAFATMGLIGAPISVDGASPPYDGSHRLVSSAATGNGHAAVQAGGASPKDANGDYVYLPVWERMYGAVQ